MSQFIQLHLLTSYPPSNLNRDDLGRPKTAIMGGANRLRVSSQSLKRAWRTSDIFTDALGEYRGTRTKRLGIEIYEALLGKDVKPKNAAVWAKAIAGVFGKLKTLNKKEEAKLAKDDTAEKEKKALTEKPFEIEQLAHVSVEERGAVSALIDALVTENRAPEKDELALLRNNNKAVDMALFGRMLASSPSYNIEAAAQVSHAITVHSAKVDEDYFTAVDDLNNHEDDAGAAHIGEAGFSAGVFYAYICINRDLLIENLQGDGELANKTIAALMECAAKVSPTGKQNSFASRAHAVYMLAEKGTQQPRSLSVAFLKPVQGQNQAEDSIEALKKQRANFDQVYGACADDFRTMNALNGEGSLEGLIKFVTE